MKKQIMYASILALAILATTTGLIINNEIEANADKKDTAEATSLDLAPARRLESKNETVYVMTDESGVVKNLFIGSTLYAGNEKLPFEMSIKYYLNGEEISTTDLAGKNGHVKIVFNYDATATYQGSKVPFVAVTGLSLDGTKFNNVKVKNGKIVSEGENYLLYGYGVAGANSNLGVDFLPERFEIEADTTDFRLGTTYTLLANDLIKDIDTSRLVSIDGLVNSINQLADGVDQLVAGSSELSDGLKTALNGAKELYAGTQTLADGLNGAASGATELSNGLETLTGYNANLILGAQAVFNSLVDAANNNLNSNTSLMGAIMAYGGAYGLSAPIALTTSNYSETLEKIEAFLTDLGSDASSIVALKAQLDNYNEFYTGLISYTSGVAEAANGSLELSVGLQTIADKIPALTTGLGTLVDGETQIYEGSVRLEDGMKTLKTNGIDKLVSFANEDLLSFSRHARQMVTAAGSYRNFGGSNAETVKFIIKTASIK